MTQQHVKAAFDRAAVHYDHYTHQQRSILQRLVALACEQTKAQPLVLDAGCGTGYLGEYSRKQALGWDIVPLDLAFRMCAQAAEKERRALNASMEQLPLADASVDLVFASSSLQWVDDIPAMLLESVRVLKPGGVLAIATYVNGTLRELQDAFKAVDGYDHTRRFVPQDVLMAGLREAGLSLRSAERESLREEYKNLAELLHYLKIIGASHKMGARRQSMMTPRQLARLAEAYPQAGADGAISASWEVCYLLAQKI